MPNQQQKLLPDSEASVTTEAPVLPDASAATSAPFKSIKLGKNHVSGSHYEKKPSIGTPNKLNWSENPIHHIYCSTFNLQRRFCKLPDLKGRF